VAWVKLGHAALKLQQTVSHVAVFTLLLLLLLLLLAGVWAAGDKW
jgi:hypothetical protein